MVRDEWGLHGGAGRSTQGCTSQGLSTHLQLLVWLLLDLGCGLLLLACVLLACVLFACPFACGLSRNKASHPRRRRLRRFVLKLSEGRLLGLGEAELLLRLAELLGRLVRSILADAVRGVNAVGGANAIELWSVGVGWGGMGWRVRWCEVMWGELRWGEMRWGEAALRDTH